MIRGFLLKQPTLWMIFSSPTIAKFHEYGAGTCNNAKTLTVPDSKHRLKK